MPFTEETQRRRAPLCDNCYVNRSSAVLPGYASVGRASQVLHLAPRSVRDLIYAGRLPSLRVGRLHFIKAADLEAERRRRLGRPVPRPAPRQPAQRRARSSASRSNHQDPALRRQRAAERAALVSRWAQRHAATEPRVPAVILGVTAPVTCDVCGRQVRRGRIVELTPDAENPPARMCTTCGRRALLDWADRRRQEAAAARSLSDSLGRLPVQISFVA
jgi:hypothetical protein